MNQTNSRQVLIGNVAVGGNNPVRIQSMTNTPTHDVEATVTQIERLVKAGCEIVRVTVQGKREARACKLIRQELDKRKIAVPLVADIHFYPPAALLVAEYVDKVRINPGNFLDKRASFKQLSYSEAEYEAEVKKIFDGFSPLVNKCKSLKRALRIGVNHGSLSDRIMNRYGDTALGMCISALEYLRVCVELEFYSVIVSMKSSNVKVMVEAYRLLVKMMQEEGMDFPLHLGVTEAGPDLEGRVKSAAGIGTLLLDGIGDTIRVSLTEDPEFEIEPAKAIAALKKLKPVLYTPIPSKEISHPLLHPKKTLFLRPKNEEQILELGYKKQFNRWMPPKRVPDLIFAEGFIKSNDPAFTVIKKFEDVDPDAKIIVYQLEDDFVYRVRQFKEKLIQAGDSRALLVEFFMPKANLFEVCANVCSLLIDEVIDGFGLHINGDINFNVELGFALMQASRHRLTNVELIACPGCGRTLFNLQEVTQRIKKKTEHLVGTKIAVMGCIVNGPGEMADADYGYVGAARGKIDLYKGKECVLRGLDQEGAEDRLLEFIESDKLLSVE
jgi:(E)-4-hydroxy-3-methylbut-2-enyl-diphosphate synthase